MNYMFSDNVKKIKHFNHKLIVRFTAVIRYIEKNNRERIPNGIA